MFRTRLLLYFLFMTNERSCAADGRAAASTAMPIGGTDKALFLFSLALGTMVLRYGRKNLWQLESC